MAGDEYTIECVGLGGVPAPALVALVGAGEAAAGDDLELAPIEEHGDGMVGGQVSKLFRYQPTIEHRLVELVRYRGGHSLGSVNMRRKNCLFLPAAGRRTQFFYLTFTEPGAPTLAPLCILPIGGHHVGALALVGVLDAVQVGDALHVRLVLAGYVARAVYPAVVARQLRLKQLSIYRVTHLDGYNLQLT